MLLYILHETTHELHEEKGVIFKIDLEKTYDQVRCFLFQTLQMKGFFPKWVTWVGSFI